MKSQKGFANIALIVVAVITVAGAGWWYLNQTSTPSTFETEEFATLQETSQQNTDVRTQPKVNYQPTQTYTPSEKETQPVQSSTKTNVGSSDAECLNLTHDLWIGKTDADTNGEVSKLQRFLGAYKLAAMDPDGDSGIPPEELLPMTGYYGEKTAAAVVQWQKAHGMDFVTTKSGVGPMTRAKLREACSSEDQTISGHYRFAQDMTGFPDVLSTESGVYYFDNDANSMFGVAGVFSPGDSCAIGIDDVVVQISNVRPTAYTGSLPSRSEVDPIFWTLILKV